jgi:hypothetical protein
MTVKIRMNDDQYDQLKSHLLHSDGKEAVAIVLCGRRRGDNAHCLLVREVHPIPYGDCDIRESELLCWKTSLLENLLPKAMQDNMAIVKIHSHPSGYAEFSVTDDASDRDLFSSVYGWMDDDSPHASMVMLPDGKMFGRYIDPDGNFYPLDLISVIGDDIHYWFPEQEEERLPEFTMRNTQAFGMGTTQLLNRLSVAVVGCSGTGSPVIEQLARLGVQKLVLVDPDPIEEKNLNRIINSTMDDVFQKKKKVNLLESAIQQMGLGTKVEVISENICTVRAVKAVAECDIIFGCMDGSEGRHLLNRLATYYQIPYFDVGVKLEADGKGNISQICGSVNYLQPGKSSLLSRNIITLEGIEAEGMMRTNPELYEKQHKEKYIKGVNVDSPAVISINMHYASMVVMEFLARIHRFRDDANNGFAQYGSSLTQSRIFCFPETEFEQCMALTKHVGKGDRSPLLDMPSLSD